MKHMIAATFALIGLTFATGALAGPIDGCPPGWHDVCADDGGDVIWWMCVPILHEDREVVHSDDVAADDTRGDEHGDAREIGPRPDPSVGPELSIRCPNGEVILCYVDAPECHCDPEEE